MNDLRQETQSRGRLSDATGQPTLGGRVIPCRCSAPSSLRDRTVAVEVAPLVLWVALLRARGQGARLIRA